MLGELTPLEETRAYRECNRSDPLSPTLPHQGGGSKRISALCRQSPPEARGV